MSETSGASPDRTSVLFVCLGNICRSPLAEGVFLDLVAEEGLDDRFRVDSAGTGAYHVGEPPDPRSAEVARKNGVTLRGRARQVEPEDFRSFDYLLAMDRSNLRNLERMEPPGSPAQVELLRAFDPDAGEDLDVPDPYYGGPGGFDRIYEMIDRACRHLLVTIGEDEGR